MLTREQVGHRGSSGRAHLPVFRLLFLFRLKLPVVVVVVVVRIPITTTVALAAGFTHCQVTWLLLERGTRAQCLGAPRRTCVAGPTRALEKLAVFA